MEHVGLGGRTGGGGVRETTITKGEESYKQGQKQSGEVREKREPNIAHGSPAGKIMPEEHRKAAPVSQI